jgi:hypothetical protein
MLQWLPNELGCGCHVLLGSYLFSDDYNCVQPACLPTARDNHTPARSTAAQHSTFCYEFRTISLTKAAGGTAIN